MNNNIERTIMHNGIVRSVTDNDDVMMTITYLRQILSLIQFMVYFIEHYNSQIQSCIKLNPNSLRPKVLTGVFHNDVSRMNATGVPPYVNLANRFSSLEKLLGAYLVT